MCWGSLWHTQNPSEVPHTPLGLLEPIPAVQDEPLSIDGPERSGCSAVVAVRTF